MTVYHVRIHDDADRGAVIEALRLHGEVREFSAIPKLLEWEGRADAETDLMQIPGVRSVERDDPQKMRPLSTHTFPYGTPEGSGQLPIIYHGWEPGDPLYNSFWDLLQPGQEAVFDYDPTAGGIGDGTGVNVYVVDSGVEATHPEFVANYGQRLYDAHPLEPSLWMHGSACAGCAAGATMGVAPGATIYDSRCFGPDASPVSTSILINGMNEALTHFNNNTQPGVMSCSFGGSGFSDAYDTVIDSCVDAGLVVVVASGNDSRDLGATDGSFNVWPAENPDSFTVGGTDERHRFISFTNYNGQTDFYACGGAWTTPWPGQAWSAPATVRGTSFSCPMVAGAMARAMTGQAKMTSRAEVDAFKTQFVADWGVEDVRRHDGLLLEGLKRLFLPGVTFTGFQPHTPPTRGIPSAFPVTVDVARTHAILGSRSDGLTARFARTHLIIEE